MGISSLDATILRELKAVAENPKIRHKDIMEWSTAEIKAEEGETLFFLPGIGLHVAVKIQK